MSAPALISLACCFALAACGGGKVQLDHYGKLPQFNLQNQLGDSFSERDLQGRVLVVDFIFTSCPDVCPLLTEQLGALRKKIPAKAPVSYVSFSVDPEHDTPERLRSFAAAHGANVEHWWFLTGPLDQVRAVVTKGFKQAMELQPAKEGQPRNVLHGSHFVLVDSQGEIRGFFANDPDGHEALRAGVLALLPKGTQQ